MLQSERLLRKVSRLHAKRKIKVNIASKIPNSNKIWDMWLAKVLVWAARSASNMCTCFGVLRALHRSWKLHTMLGSSFAAATT